MAVIWREDLNIKGKVYKDVKVYKSSSYIVTNDEEKRAEKLDQLIESKINKIKFVAKRKGLLKLKQKTGVLDLWYLVGENLQFIDKSDLILAEDKKFICEAIWYHVEKIAPELIPGKQKKRRGTYRDHFLQCFKIGKFSKEVAKKAGSWSDWVEFFDSSTINEDNRILDWVIKKCNSEITKNYWLKSFYRLLKREFIGKISTVFSNAELNNRLEQVWNKHKA